MSTFRKTANAPARLGLAFVGMLALAGAAPAQAPATPPAKAKAVKGDSAAPATAPVNSSHAELAPQINLAEGKSTLVHLPFVASRLAVGDAKVADVILLNPSEVYMVGKSVGSTNLILWNKNNDATIIDIGVTMDIAPLQARLSKLFPNETTLQLTAAGDAVIVAGSVPDVVRADQVLSIVAAFVQRGARSAGAAPAAGAAGAAATALSPRVINMLSIAAPQQVMLEVKVAEVSKTLVDQLGASIGASGTRGNWTYTFLSNLLTGKPGVGDAFNNKNGNFLTFDAQKTDGLVKVLAEPTIMAISGQEASFLAGGKIFIPVSLSNNNGQPTVSLEEKEFGIAVRFTPTVLDGGRINLKVAPEVSDLNKDGVGITATGVSGTAILPSFTTRRASTVVQLQDGQSFAIGGLIKNNVTTNIKAFPMLGEIPVLGALFRSSNFQTDRTELVFIVTPHLVKPLGPNIPLPTDGYIAPSRSQFFLQGKMEGQAPVAAAPAAPAPATGFDLK
ncbi:MAG: type II and III secretion system protein family protein [Pseudomonadota bacterium]